MKKTMDDQERKEHFMNAYYNYLPVLKRLYELDETCLNCSDETFPEDWTDPLELYGRYLTELKKHTSYLYGERRELLSLLEQKGPEFIWRNRWMLVAQRIFILNF